MATGDKTTKSPPGDGSSVRRTCSRRGCGSVEQHVADFARCSSCKATVYCSTTCQKLDVYTGHGACTLKGLVDASKDGVWTASECKQAAKLLTSNLRTPLFRPTLATIEAALRTLAASISHPATCPQLVPQHRDLLAALVQAYDVHPIGGGTEIFARNCPPEYHDIDIIAAAALHLSAPTICQLMLDPANQGALTAVGRANGAFGQSRNRFLRLQVALFSVLGRARYVARVHQVRGFISGAALMEDMPTTISGLRLGVASAALCSLFTSMKDFVEASGEFEVQESQRRRAEETSQFCSGHGEGDPAALCFITWMYEAMDATDEALPPQLEMMLGIGGVSYLRQTHGCICRLMLESSPSAEPLVRVLQRLSKLPRTTLAADQWQLGLCASEMLMVGEWGQWMASREGLVGLEVLAGLFMKPALVLTHKLLSTSGISLPPKAATHLLCSALKTVAHLAATNTGRKQLADGQCISQWAALLPSLLPAVQQHVLLVFHSSCNDWASNTQPYWCPLYGTAGAAVPSPARTLLTGATPSYTQSWSPDTYTLGKLLVEYMVIKCQLLAAKAGTTQGRPLLLDVDVEAPAVDELVDMKRTPRPMHNGIVVSWSSLEPLMAFTGLLLTAHLQREADAAEPPPAVDLPKLILGWLAAFGHMFVTTRGSSFVSDAQQDGARAFLLRFLEDLPAVLAGSKQRQATTEARFLPAVVALLRADICSSAARCLCKLSAAASLAGHASSCAAALAGPQPLLQLLEACTSVRPAADATAAGQPAVSLAMMSTKRLQSMAAARQLEVNSLLLTVLGRTVSHAQGWPEGAALASHRMLLSNVPLWESLRMLLRSNVAASSKEDWGEPLRDLASYLTSAHPARYGLGAEVQQAVRAAGGARAVEAAVAGGSWADDTQKALDQLSKMTVQHQGLGAAAVAVGRCQRDSPASEEASSSSSSAGVGAVSRVDNGTGGTVDASRRVCAMCGPQAGPTQRCGGCQQVRYCSVQCQKAHWNQHKAACRLAARAAAQQG